jgi:hypothetical protein
VYNAIRSRWPTNTCNTCFWDTLQPGFLALLKTHQVSSLLTSRSPPTRHSQAASYYKPPLHLPPFIQASCLSRTHYTKHLSSPSSPPTRWQPLSGITARYGPLRRLTAEFIHGSPPCSKRRILHFNLLIGHSTKIRVLMNIEVYWTLRQVHWCISIDVSKYLSASIFSVMQSEKIALIYHVNKGNTIFF